MFFVLSKILGFLAIPSNLLGLAGLAGAGLLLTRWRRLSLTLLVGSVAMLAVLGISPLSNVLLLTLSERFPAWQSGSIDPDGVIVLGGVIDPEASDARGVIELDSSAERAVALLTLARRFPNARIVFTGGSGKLTPGALAEAPFAKKLLAEFALSGDRFIFEDASRTTYENAVWLRDMLKPAPGQRFLLDRVSGGLSRADVAIHEWTGLIVYWLTGRSSELFPGPRTAGCDNASAKDSCRPR
jgi:uncharacterized SAM-binding protein YcdF (DUF218 family)